MTRLYRAGGALGPDDLTYIERDVDMIALRSIQNREYIYITAPRQTGKTSLMMKLLARLTRMGWRCAYIDFSPMMDLVKPAWYAELGHELGCVLTPNAVPTLTNQIDLRHYLIEKAFPWADGHQPIAFFFDEVEGVAQARDAEGKSFSDTFFMVLRNLFIQRDTFDCSFVVALAGSLNPEDLVKDPNISPFNIGVEINLNDLTSAESRVLTGHLSKLNIPYSENVHQSIYNWTNGHPYLTQRICAELEKAVESSKASTITPELVDQIVDELFISPASPALLDKNIRHVSKMISGLTGAANQIWTQIGTEPSRVSPRLDLELYLTGAVKFTQGRLAVRNRIYQRALSVEPSAPLSMRVERQLPRITAAKALRVFISSTWEDLQTERKAVENALQRMQNSNFAGMEYFGSRPETPRQVSLSEVDSSDVYVGIFGHRYGSGITELEYRRAQKLKMPCLIYFKDDSVSVQPAHIDRDPGKAKKLDALKQDLKSHHTVSIFQTSDNLATMLVTDLHNLIERDELSAS